MAPQAVKIIINLLKIGAAGGALKVSIDQGIWDISTDRGKRLYQKVKEKVVPGTIVYPEKMPSNQQLKESFEKTWNTGVQKVFHAAEVTPQKTSGAIARFIKES